MSRRRSSDTPRSPLLLAGVLALVALVRCGGTSSPSKPAADSITIDAGVCSRSVSGETHRCPSHACPASVVGQPLPCTTDGDCELDDAGVLYQGTCRDRVCRLDQCLTDDDCAPGTACSCLGDYGGNGEGRNWCVPADCRTDSDCGQGGVCSPSFGHGSVDPQMILGQFVNTQGFFCHTPRDLCTTDESCGGPDSMLSCQYVPAYGTVDAGGGGYWTCVAAPTTHTAG
jgi:hypothetical protein